MPSGSTFEVKNVGSLNIHEILSGKSKYMFVLRCRLWVHFPEFGAISELEHLWRWRLGEEAVVVWGKRNQRRRLRSSRLVPRLKHNTNRVHVLAQLVPLLRGALAMAAPTAHVLVVLLVASFCCISLSHGRIVPGDISISSLPSAKVRGLQRDGAELNSDCNGVTVSEGTPPMKGDDKSFSRGRIVSRTGDADSDWQFEDRSVSIALKGKKWRRTLGKIAEWVLHACVVLLVFSAVFYAVSCCFACCIGLDLLAEIWRSLGGCGAFTALLSYFVNFEQAITEAPLLAGSAQQP